MLVIYGLRHALFGSNLVFNFIHTLISTFFFNERPEENPNRYSLFYFSPFSASFSW